MTYIRTSLGHQIDYVGILKGKPQSFDIRDIATALAKEPRFGGFTRGRCSVAAHSIRVYHMVREHTQEVVVRRAALLHDAAEAYLKDLPRGLKQMLPDYRYLEGRTNLLLSKQFEFPWPLPAIVDEADHEVLLHEWVRYRDDDPPGDVSPGVKLSYIEVSDYRFVERDFLAAAMEVGIK